MRTLIALLLCIGLAFAFPTLHPGLNDLAGVVNGSDAQAINDLCTLLEKNTTVECAVLFVNTTEPYEIADYTVQTGEQNGIGKKETDNGILMVIAVVDREYYTAVGYGLEGDLNDGKLGEIQRNYLVPELKNGNWGKAAYDTLQQYGVVLGAVNATTIIYGTGTLESMPLDGFLFIILVVVVLFVVLALLAGGTSGGYSGGSSGGGGYIGGGGFSGGSSGGSSGGGSFGGGSFGGGGAGGRF